MRIRSVVAVLIAAIAAPAFSAEPPHNLILFVPDGLRAASVDAANAPTMARLRNEGVSFRNSHSLFPTFTTANASAFATGHGLGDTGDFGNTIYTGLPFQGSVTPFVENDVILREINLHWGGNYLHEPSIIGTASANGWSTALIGKLGPIAIFDPTALAGKGTLIVDDNTGQSPAGMAVPEEWRKIIADAHIKPLDTPARSDNGRSGTFVPNWAQQQYFLEVTIKAVLPRFKQLGKPFVIVYWSRDPDGSQHTQGDGDINGPTSLTALRAADGSLAAIEQTLKQLGLFDTTNIIVSADHGFSTLSKESAAGPLPVGFLAKDLALALRKSDARIKLFDPDADNKELDPAKDEPSKANGVIGADSKTPLVVVASNGGSDLVYLPVPEQRRARKLAREVVHALLEKDYVSGLFVDETRFGKIDGALSLADIGLHGDAATPRPSIVVNFRSYIAPDCDKTEKTLCSWVVSDHTYPQGGGMHGSLSRSDVWNFMAARGPDFRAGHVDELPASNADIGATMAQLLQLNLVPHGKLIGRALDESLRAHENDPTPAVTTATLVSKPAANGLKTELHTQTIGGHVYIDVGGFAGRTVGLDPALAAPETAPYVDLTGDFLRCFDGTKAVDTAARVAAFRTRMDALLPGFYTPRDAVTPERYDARVAKALESFDALRPRFERMRDDFPAAYAAGIEHFRKSFPGWKPGVPVYLLHSLGEMDGGIRVLGGKSYLVFGADVIATIHDAHTLTPFLDHELFHVENGEYFPECGQVWCALWGEGLAVYAAEVMNPGADDRQLLLTQPAPIRAATDAKWRDAVCFTRAKLESSSATDVNALFAGGGNAGEFPERFGYYVGLRAIESLKGRYDLAALAHMRPPVAKRTLARAMNNLAAGVGGCK